MLQNESILEVVDNSGALKLLIIRCLGGSRRRYARIGDTVIATVKKAKPNANIKKGQVIMALIVSTKKYFHRENNTWIKFSKNCAVLIKKEDKTPLGTRVFIPLLSELYNIGYKGVFSLANEIL